MGPPVPFPYVPTPHGVPVTSSQAGYHPYMASSHIGYRPPMENTEVVPRSKLDRLLKGTQLILENAMLEQRARLNTQIDKTIAMQSQYASFMQNPSNQQTSPF